MEVKQNNIEEKKKLVEAANFVLRKFLAETNLLERKERILEEELRQLEQNIKMRRIKNIIDKND